MKPFVFPRWANKTVPVFGLVFGMAPVYLVFLIWYGASPKTTDVGYAPEQPIPYSHALHAGELGIDCRYCHNTVEQTAHAAIPATETCMNCHQRIKTKSPKLEVLRDSWTEGTAVQWKKVHDLPDYVYFNHSAHVRRGVGCVSCHGRIDQMEVVFQHETLSMGWCLDCHRNPDPNLRPTAEVTNMTWAAPEGDAVALGKQLRAERGLNPSTDCSTCHR
jgi:hypothetical protein